MGLPPVASAVFLTYHLRFIPEGEAEASQIFFRDTHALPKLVRYEEHYGLDRWPAHRRLIAFLIDYT
jgi:hypothetical protein